MYRIVHVLSAALVPRAREVSVLAVRDARVEFAQRLEGSKDAVANEIRYVDPEILRGPCAQHLQCMRP